MSNKSLLQRTMAQQNVDKFVSSKATQRLFVLPIFQVPLKRMTESQLRSFIPNMLICSMGSAEFNWNDELQKPPWWPSDIKWANIWTNDKSDSSMQTTNYRMDALQKVIFSCYKYHGQEEQLSIIDEENVDKCGEPDNMNPLSILDIEFYTICRLCLSNATSAVVDVFSFSDDEEIASIVSQHFWFQIFKGDGESDRLCTNCWVATKSFHKFYKDVQQIHNYPSKNFGKIQQLTAAEENINDTASLQHDTICEISNFLAPVTTVKPFECNQSDNKCVALNETLPYRYQNAYEMFMKWQQSKEIISFAESVLLAYFSELSMKYKPSSLWSMYSMLKSTIMCNHNINISEYSQLLAFLKKKYDGFHSKKSKLFTPEEVIKFLVEAPDHKYLVMKTVLVIAAFGTYNGLSEMAKFKIDYLKDNGSEIIVRMPDKKTKGPKTYVIDGHFAEIVRKYMQLRPRILTTDRFFMQYQNGKCTNKVIGKNNISKMPKEVAKFLKLPDAEVYTGYSFPNYLLGTGFGIDNTQQVSDKAKENINETEIDTELEQKIPNTNNVYEAMDSQSFTPEVENFLETDDTICENTTLHPKTEEPFECNESENSCEEVLSETLPEKIRERYKHAYEKFMKWQQTKGDSSFAEPVLLAYFSELSKKYKYSSLWSVYSMLKRTIMSNQNINISEYSQVITFLKKKYDGSQSKIAKSFTSEEVTKFLMEAPDDKYLSTKTVLVFGVFGAYRGEEMVNIKTDDVKDNGNEIVVTMPDKKANGAKIYVINGKYAETVRKYMNLRSQTVSTDRFFMQYRNGYNERKVTVMGKNSFSKMPKAIAKFLNLPEAEAYSAHSFRNILPGTDVKIETLKQQGLRKSSRITEGCIQESSRIFRKRKFGVNTAEAISLSSMNNFTADVTNSESSSLEQVQFDAAHPTKLPNIN